MEKGKVFVCHVLDFVQSLESLKSLIKAKNVNKIFLLVPNRQTRNIKGFPVSLSLNIISQRK